MSEAAWSDVGRRKQTAVSHPLEREAVLLLFLAGWSISELSMVFEVSDEGIRRILRDEGCVENISDLRDEVQEVDR